MNRASLGHPTCLTLTDEGGCLLSRSLALDSNLIDH